MELTSLFKNFEQEIPRINNLTPKWDLNLVLNSLIQAPYEPLKLANLHNLTLKTVFLLALATTKRVSELHALSHVVNHSSHWKSVTLTFSPDFVAKTQLPGRSETSYGPITVPALSQILGPGDEEKALCPVRALKEYLKRTQDTRSTCHHLFISTNTRNPRSISKNTLSFWIRKVIKKAYSKVSSDQASFHKITPHELRAMGTSLAFARNASISQVMDAASWRCHSTFASHYLRDCTHKYLDTYSLGPVVAAQRIV